MNMKPSSSSIMVVVSYSQRRILICSSLRLRTVSRLISLLVIRIPMISFASNCTAAMWLISDALVSLETLFRDDQEKRYAPTNLKAPDLPFMERSQAIYVQKIGRSNRANKPE